MGPENFDASTDFLFIYDIKKEVPVLKQVSRVPYCYNGIVFDPNGKSFYLVGGSSTTTSSTTPADNVRVYTSRGETGAKTPSYPG